MPRTDIYDDVSEDVLIPSKADQNNRAVWLLFHEHQTDKESGNESEEDIFGKAVKAASNILELELSLTITEARLAARHFVDLYLEGEDLSELISELIKESEQEPIDGEKNYPLLAYDALGILNDTLALGTGPIPPELINFTFEVRMDTGKHKTKRKRPRHTRRGRSRDTNLGRDIALIYTHIRMVPWGYPKFRSEKKDKEHVEDERRCSYKGKSTIDIVGCAYEKVTGNELRYPRLEQIILSDLFSDTNPLIKNYILNKLDLDRKFASVGWM